MSKQELSRRVETISILDIEKLCSQGFKFVVFGIADARNGLGGPTVALYSGAGICEETACADALSGLKEVTS